MAVCNCECSEAVSDFWIFSIARIVSFHNKVFDSSINSGINVNGFYIAEYRCANGNWLSKAKERERGRAKKTDMNNLCPIIKYVKIITSSIVVS